MSAFSLPAILVSLHSRVKMNMHYIVHNIYRTVIFSSVSNPYPSDKGSVTQENVKQSLQKISQIIPQEVWNTVKNDRGFSVREKSDIILTLSDYSTLPHL